MTNFYVYQGFTTFTDGNNRLIAWTTATATPKMFSTLDAFLDSQECEAKVNPVFEQCNCTIYGKLVHVNPDGLVARVIEKQRTFSNYQELSLIEAIQKMWQARKSRMRVN